MSLIQTRLFLLDEREFFSTFVFDVTRATLVIATHPFRNRTFTLSLIKSTWKFMLKNEEIWTKNF